MTEYNAKIKEIEDRLSAAEAELRALKAGDNKDDLPEPPHPRPMLNCSKMCYHIDSTGTVLGGPWDNTTWDYKRLAIGNVFLTEEAADFAAERLKVLAEMSEWSGKCADPYEIIYNYSTDMVIPNMDSDIFVHGDIRFASYDDAYNCIKAVGKDRLKLYYFGIPEDRGCCTSER